MLENNKNSALEKGFKIVTGIVSCLFLTYTLFAFDGYNNLSSYFSKVDIYHWNILFSVILLVPFNWYLESIKWKVLLAGLEPVSLRTSAYSVLTGLTTGIFSPGRLGEFAGRVLLLHPQNRKKATALWAVGSMTMTIAIFLLGIPAFCFFVNSGKEINLWKESFGSYYLFIAILSALFLVLLYFFIPYINKLFSGKFSGHFSSITRMLRKLSFLRLSNILVISLFRYLIFCLQFWLTLYFFGIELSLPEACTGIFTAYLFITFLPSFFMTEAAVKSSVFVLMLSSFSNNSVAILSASMLLWILNLAIPTVLGILLLTQKRGMIKQER